MTISCKTSIRLLFALCAIALFTSVTSCKKEDQTPELNISGKVVDSTTGNGVSGASVQLAQKILSDGTFSNIFQPIESVSTNSAGNYDFSFEREAASEYRIVVEKDNYFSSTVFINPDNVGVDNPLNQSIVVSSKAWVKWQITNSNPVGAADFISFAYLNANFECQCCTNDEVQFTGTAVNQSSKCLAEGNYNLKFRYTVVKDTSNYTVIDSLITIPFDTTFIAIDY